MIARRSHAQCQHSRARAEVIQHFELTGLHTEIKPGDAR